MRASIHLASTHPPFDTRIFHKECQTLVRAGYPVTLIVPHTHDEVVGGVRIRAVPRPADGRTRLTTTLGQLYRAALAEDPGGVFHFHDAELIFHMLRLKAQGRTVVYDAHEDTPKQVMYQHWIPRAARPAVAAVMAAAEWLGGHVFDGIIAAEPGILQRYPRRRRVLVHNFPILDELVPPRPTPYQERPMRVAYVGSISEARGVRELVAAMARLPEPLGAELILGGAFHPAALEADVRQLDGFARTRLLGYLDRRQVAEVFGQSRIGIVTIYPTRKYLESYPTKLFEYMAAGLPVVASDFPGWRGFVEAHRCGLLVDPRDPAAIAGAVQWLFEHPAEAEAMGQRGRAAAEAHYNWAHEAETLRHFYERLEGRG